MKNIYENLRLCELCQEPLRVIGFNKEVWHATCTHCGALHQGTFR